MSTPSRPTPSSSSTSSTSSASTKPSACPAHKAGRLGGAAPPGRPALCAGHADGFVDAELVELVEELDGVGLLGVDILEVLGSRDHHFLQVVPAVTRASQVA